VSLADDTFLVVADGVDASAPAVRDPEVDRALAILDEVARLLVDADLESAKQARNQADAAALLARRKRAEDVHRKAAEVKLKAEARLGQLAGEPLDEAGRAAAARAARSDAPAGTQKPVLVDLDRNDIARCRKVWGAHAYLSAYLDYVREAGEEPTRAGLLRYAADQERAKAEARAEQAPPATTPRQEITVPAAPSRAVGPPRPAVDVGRVVTSGRMAEEERPAAEPSPLARGLGVAVGSRWVTRLDAVLNELRLLATVDKPARMEIASLPDARELEHTELLRLLNPAVTALQAARAHAERFRSKREPELLEGHAAQQQKRRTS
jgi:hypothetical protein